MRIDHQIPIKANRILNIILLCLLLILIRVWYLSVIKHEEGLEQSRKPQRRTVIEQVERATIRDRFNLPMAINKIQYNASICYANIRQIPSFAWEDGKRVHPRADYITKLAQLLAKELSLDPLAIEDLIHAKASLFPHTPFVIKENLSEGQYYHLKMLEKDWLGIHMQRASKRIYPQGKVGADVIGYLAAISEKEYQAIASEIFELQEYLAQREAGEMPFLPAGFESPVEVRDRLAELQEKAYTINDYVGKMGIEGTFDSKLRGFYGKKVYEVDVKGNFLRELPGSKKAMSGQRIVLSLSSELQEYAEALLAEHEACRGDAAWIKGGAIVAIVPDTGEVVALASYPRFDPNDFIPVRDPKLKKEKQSALLNWLENEAYIGEIWDGKRPMQRERYSFATHSFYEEVSELTWDHYLSLILSPKSRIQGMMEQVTDIQTAVAVQEGRTSLLEQIIDDEDKLLANDLCRLAARREDFSPQLLAAVGHQSLPSYRLLCQATSCLQSQLKTQLQELFHAIEFSEWRALYFKDFLREMRKEEKENRRYTRPYIEYLEMVEKRMFKTFWDSCRYKFLEALILEKEIPEFKAYFPHLTTLSHPLMPALKSMLSQLSPALAESYLKSMHPFEELSNPLVGKYRFIRSHLGKQRQKDLAAAFYPLSGYGYARSQAYRQSTPQGSVFKLVTAYGAIKNRPLFALNPLTVFDDPPSYDSSVLGRTLTGEPIFRNYKEGKLPRSSHANIGKVDLLGALEQSSNFYFSLLAGDHMDTPMALAHAARLFGFGERSGIELPGEIPGTIPEDLMHNRTGLYAFAIGQHSLTVTPLQTAVMLSAIANEGKILKPQIVQLVVGKEPSREEDPLFSERKYPFKEDLALMGIDFPLFTETQKNQEQPCIHYTPTEVRRVLYFPPQIRHLLLEGMRRVVTGPRGTSRASIIRNVSSHKDMLSDYIDLQHQLVGKTGTAEIRYKQTIDAETPASMQTHVWFGGISFKEDNSFEHPDLVVVVYLRFGQAGKEAAPLAAQIVKKWRELCAFHSGS